MKPSENFPILICAATSIEARACQAGLNTAEFGYSFEVLQTGMGPHQSRQRLEKRLQDSSLKQPCWIISTGFAGSLVPTIARFRWIVGSEVSCHSEQNPGQNKLLLKIDPLGEHLDTIGLPWSSARVKSASQIVSQHTREDDLSQVVDMESHALALIARKFDIPFHIFRLISDTPKHPIPRSIAAFTQAFTRTDEPSWRIRTQAQTRAIAQGIRATLRQPKELSSFLTRSASLPQRLQRGWALAANILANTQLD